MTDQPYYTRSRASASTPPPPPRRRRIVVRLRPRDNSAPAAEPPASPVPARLVDPLDSLAVPASPLEPLFLGVGDDTVVSGQSGSPPPALAVPARAGEDYSPASPPRPDLYEVDAHRPPRELDHSRAPGTLGGRVSQNANSSSDGKRGRRLDPGCPPAGYSRLSAGGSAVDASSSVEESSHSSSPSSRSPPSNKW